VVVKTEKVAEYRRIRLPETSQHGVAFEEKLSAVCARGLRL
jgi:hypothetical protein